MPRQSGAWSHDLILFVVDFAVDFGRIVRVPKCDNKRYSDCGCGFLAVCCNRIDIAENYNHPPRNQTVGNGSAGGWRSPKLHIAGSIE